LLSPRFSPSSVEEEKKSCKKRGGRKRERQERLLVTPLGGRRHIYHLLYSSHRRAGERAKGDPTSDVFIIFYESHAEGRERGLKKKKKKKRGGRKPAGLTSHRPGATTVHNREGKKKGP